MEFLTNKIVRDIFLFDRSCMFRLNDENDIVSKQLVELQCCDDEFSCIEFKNGNELINQQFKFSLAINDSEEIDIICKNVCQDNELDFNLMYFNPENLNVPFYLFKASIIIYDICKIKKKYTASFKWKANLEFKV